MLGAIVGDIIGSPYEFSRVADKDFELFRQDSHYTDDTLLTLMTARGLQTGESYALLYRKAFQAEPHQSWGLRFMKWCESPDLSPYNSLGNGSAMRVSPVAWYFDDERQVLEEATRTAEVTHNHPEGIKGARATALAIFLARRGADRDTIRQRIGQDFGYDLDRSMQTLYETYHYNETCQGTIPEALICFLASTDFEDAIRNAVAINGDADTLAAITGSIAEALYGGVPAKLENEARRRLPIPFIDQLNAFQDAAAGVREP
ncbi:ADP-ribosylglycohydrolase family protein [Methylonatrum kenyense]|uniref:ADP-ribosylglycohydrolase family protein n=1 Tax=Methylonatrum kenyense TaxID=455253 RepID=UPI0020BF92FC|nr:ADP-ribosylglycohydrolase family protein [Methylonatrum kenyense]MCK8514993.1 ADP-ribosylglycohydrolase family protein [Methylonatrum kenyense]